MKLNKSTRVRSAVVVRAVSQERVFSGHNKRQISKDSKIKSVRGSFFKEIRSPEDEAIKQRQTISKSTIKDISRIYSFNCNKYKNTLLKGYDHQTWRTINTARSQSRLLKMSQVNNKDPIKINLQQKLQRIRQKHSQNQRNSTHGNSATCKNKVKKITQERTNPISNKIKEILEKWQRQKSYSSSIYRRKIETIFLQSQITE